MLHAGLAASFEEIERAVDVGAHIKPRVGDGRAHSGAGGEVEYFVEPGPGEQRFHERLVADVAIHDGDPVAESGDVRLLDRRIVEIVEIIDDCDFRAVREQGFAKVGGDEPGAAGDEDVLSHGRYFVPL